MEEEREQRLRMLGADLAYASRKAGRWTAACIGKLLAGYSLVALVGAWTFGDGMALGYGPAWLRVLHEMAIVAGLPCAGVWAIIRIASLGRRLDRWLDRPYHRRPS